MKTDTHHILFPKSDWKKNAAKRLRNHWYLTPKIPKDTMHKAIHENVSFVPVPSEKIIRDALVQIHLLEGYGVLHIDDPISKRIALLASFFECCCPDTVEALEKQYKIATRFEKISPT